MSISWFIRYNMMMLMMQSEHAAQLLDNMTESDQCFCNDLSMS